LNQPGVAPVIRYAGLMPASIVFFILPITHTVAIRLICLGVALLVAAHLWINERPAFPRFLLLAIACWAGIALLTLSWSIDVEYSIGEVRNEIGYAMAAFFTFYALTRSEGELRLWLRLVTVSALVVGTYGFGAWVWYGEWHSSGWVSDRNLYSTYVVIAVPLLALSWRLASVPIWRWLAAVAILITLVDGGLTVNRTVWIALSIQGLVFVVLWRRHMHRSSSIRPVHVVLVSVILASVAATVWVVGVKSRTGVSITSAADLVARVQKENRIQMWRYAVTRAAERPWTGYGFGRGILRKDFRAQFQDKLQWHGHNIFLNYTLEGGIGLALALGVLFAALAWSLYGCYASENVLARRLGVTGLVIIVGVLVKTATDDVLVRDNALLFWCAMGMTIGLGRRLSAHA
jgi:O-antigen ligase